MSILGRLWCVSRKIDGSGGDAQGRRTDVRRPRPFERPPRLTEGQPSKPVALLRFSHASTSARTRSRRPGTAPAPSSPNGGRTFRAALQDGGVADVVARARHRETADPANRVLDGCADSADRSPGRGRVPRPRRPAGPHPPDRRDRPPRRHPDIPREPIDGATGRCPVPRAPAYGALLRRSLREPVVDVALQEQEDHQGRDDHEDGSGRDVLPVRAERPLEPEQGRGHGAQLL